VIITPDSESGNLGSNPGGTYINFLVEEKDNWWWATQSIQPFGNYHQISIFSLGKKQTTGEMPLKDQMIQLFENDKSLPHQTVRIPVGPTLFFWGKKQTIGDEHPKASRLWESAIRFLFFL
jgi:hypothetical protein